MNKNEFILITTIIILMFALGIVTFQLITIKEEVKRAEELSRATKQLIKLEFPRCKGMSEKDFESVKHCVYARMNYLNNLEKDKIEDKDVRIIPYNERTNEPGIVILTNPNKEPYNSTEFKLLLNGKIMDEGCELKGEIKEKYPCKMILNKTYRVGDVITILYNNKEIYAKVIQ